MGPCEGSCTAWWRGDCEKTRSLNDFRIIVKVRKDLLYIYYLVFTCVCVSLRELIRLNSLGTKRQQNYTPRLVEAHASLPLLKKTLGK